MLKWLPENVSTFGADVDHVIYLILYIVGLWFLLAMGLSHRIRHRISKEGRSRCRLHPRKRSQEPFLHPRPVGACPLLRFGDRFSKPPHLEQDQARAAGGGPDGRHQREAIYVEFLPTRAKISDWEQRMM